jgi:hypothetical protein
MSDLLFTFGRLLMLVLVPVWLLFPLSFAALVPNRATDDSARIKARGLLLTLAISTAVLFAIWVGLGGVRTASLVNRERTSPVTRAMWAVPITLFIVILAPIDAGVHLCIGAKHASSGRGVAEGRKGAGNDERSNRHGDFEDA